MSSLFGGPKPSIFGNTPSTGFGNTNNTNQPSTTSGGFGAPQQPANPGLFGATTGSGNASGAPSLFGNNPSTSTANPSPFSQLTNQGNANTGMTAPTGSIFGGTGGTTTNAPTTGLFGNTTNAPASGAFGNTNNNTGTGLFGNASTNTNTGTGTGTGLFGNTNTAAQAPVSGGLFGNSTTPPASNTIGGGGLFGNTGGMNGGTSTAGLSANTTNNPTNTGFLGGNTSTSLFGQTQQQPVQQSQPPQPSISVFGSSTSNQANQPLFGAQSNANKVGSNPGLFSASTLGSQPTTSGLFGQRSTLSSSFLPTSSASTLSSNPQPDIQQRIEGIVAAWDPSNPQCRFQHYFYNLVDPNQVGLYGRPSNATNDALWTQAVRENPDPKCMVPVLALGFDDLQKRVDAQSTQAKLHTEKLKELQSRIATLAQTHVLSTTRNTTRVLQTHTLINHRLLRLVEHIHLLIPNLRSTAISPEEESLRANLERLREELSSGNGRGRLNELWALLGAVKAAKERGGGSEGMEWKVVDWDGLERLAAILAEQQQGLAHLTSVINNGLKDLQIMDGGAQNSLPESVNSHFLQSSMFGNSRR